MSNSFMMPHWRPILPDTILRVSGLPGAEVETTFGNKKRTGTINEEGTVDIIIPTPGTWTVTATIHGYNSSGQVEISRFGVTEYEVVINLPLSICTPNEIDYICKSGHYAEMWNLNDEIQIPFDGENTTFVLIGIDHDVTPTGETIPLTLFMKDCFPTIYPISTSTSSSGGWNKCYFRTTTVPALLQTLPPEWQSIITPCQKKTTSGNGGTLTNTTDTIFPLSDDEMGHNAVTSSGTTISLKGEGTRYSVFSTADTDSARIKNRNGEPAVYWTRSARQDSAGWWICMGAAGKCGYRYPNHETTAIAVGFCVGGPSA